MVALKCWPSARLLAWFLVLGSFFLFVCLCICLIFIFSSDVKLACNLIFQKVQFLLVRVISVSCNPEWHSGKESRTKSLDFKFYFLGIESSSEKKNIIIGQCV